MTPAQRRAELAGQIADLVCAWLPGVDPAAARQTVDRAAKNVPGTSALLEHLQRHPDALRSGSSEAPLSLVRLIHALVAAGVDAEVRPPACATCGKITADLRGRGEPGLVCQSCYKDARRESCTLCGAFARVAVRGPDGPVCNRCYLRDPSRHEVCVRCGQLRRVAWRDEDQRPWCTPCYPRPQRVCVGCGEIGPATAITEAGPVCARCHDWPKRLCGQCNRLRTITVRAKGDTPDLCDSCYRGPIDTCSQCGQRRPRKGRRDGEPVCHRCYVRPPDRCDFCGEVRLITARWQTGAACPGCYARVRANPVECPGCGQPRALTHLDTGGAAVCATCAGAEETYLCSRCGQLSDGLVRDVCSRCILHERVDELLGDATTGVVPAHLEAIHRALGEAENPRSVLSWLARSNGARILTELASHSGPLTHEVLDAYPRGKISNQIRHALIKAGALPERDELIEQVESWLDDVLRGRPHAHVQLVRPFAQWVVLRRARRRVRSRPFTEASASWARQQIRVALDFLAWLDEHGLALTRVDQPTVDRWLTEGASSRYTVRYFLSWARRHDLADPVEVPLRRPKSPEQALPADERWHHLRRCLHDPGLPLRVRVAGALLLLYGQPVSHIVRTCSTHLSERDGVIYLTLDRHPVILPPILAKLVNELHRTATPKTVLGGRGSSTSWLFPGQLPGQHLTDNFLVRELNQHGIHARTSRSAALIDLAGDLPAAVLADLLGMHINTAVRWVQRARRDWTAYLAARAADLNKQKPATPH